MKFKLGDLVFFTYNYRDRTGLIISIEEAQGQYKVEFTVENARVHKWCNEHELELVRAAPIKEEDPLFTMNIKEVKGLYEALEFQFIHQDREEAHSVMKRMQTFLKEFGIGK